MTSATQRMSATFEVKGAAMDLNVVKNATCTFCGCVCDDIELHADGVRIVETKRACILGESWFKNHTAEHLYPDALIDGEISIGTYTPDQIQRSDVLALAQRVDYVADPTSAFPKTFPARVEIELSDGTTFAQEHYEPRGSRGRPATDTDLEVKFRDNVQASGLSLHPTTLLKSVDAFEGEATVDGLLSAFAPL